MDIQNYLRQEVRRLKWEEDISYKMIAEDLLDMSYHAFMNFLYNYKNLGYKRVNILLDFINTMS